MICVVCGRYATVEESDGPKCGYHKADFQPWRGRQMPYRTMKPIDPPPPLPKKLSEFPDTVAGLREIIDYIKENIPGRSCFGLYWPVTGGGLADDAWFVKLVAVLEGLDRRIEALEELVTSSPPIVRRR